jgi:hypothetical protein
VDVCPAAAGTVQPGLMHQGLHPMQLEGHCECLQHTTGGLDLWALQLSLQHHLLLAAASWTVDIDR